MNINYTHICVVLDRSGSMSSVWNDTVGGLKTIIRDNKAEKSKCTFSLYSFDNIIETNIDFVDIQKVHNNIEKYEISPRGSTALYDAIGKAIVETGEALNAMAENDRPGRVLIIVQTDGQENSSKEYTASKIKELVIQQTEKYNWVFNFIGSSESSVLDATDKLGFDLNRTSFYDSTNTNNVFEILRSKTINARQSSHDEYMTAMMFSESEKKNLSTKTV